VSEKPRPVNTAEEKTKILKRYLVKGKRSPPSARNLTSAPPRARTGRKLYESRPTVLAAKASRSRSLKQARKWSWLLRIGATLVLL